MDPTATVGIASVPNLRDLGGHATLDGRLVRTGLLYRSDQLCGITPEDMARIASLGLRTVFDLRGEEEAAAQPDELPEGVERLLLDVLADVDRSGPVLLGQLLEHPAEANALLGGGKVDGLFDRAYRGFVSLPSARRAYGRLFGALADPARLPALFHCMTGKDRTGWAAAALLTLLGVPRDAVMEDYLLSNGLVLPRYRQTIEAFVAAGGERAIPEAVFGVKPEYLEASFDEVDEAYGTIDRYFSDGLGIDTEGQRALREACLAAPRQSVRTAGRRPRSRTGRSPR